ncbi:MAG: leucine-rich repeat domain-containing protein, partial [Bacteroidales bacterium]|nr:leucine-rich repeat domain-containing protein [Bacteroidales bacterium]
AFSNCAGLDSAFFNPQQSGGYTFSNCINLRHLTIGNALSIIPLCFCNNCTSLQEIVIPDNVTSVYSSAFVGCTSLESAVIGSGLTKTGNSMFEDCTSLKNVTIPDGIKTIGSFTFRNCISLSEAILPAEINSVGGYAYAGCSGIEKIVCMKQTVPTTGAHAFDSIDSGIEVIVPCNKEELYSQATQWQRFENIEGKRYYVVVSTNTPDWGSAVATKQPTCDDNTATIEATPEEGYRFVKWDDNNTDNPRQIAYNGQGYVHRTALFERTVGIEAVEELSDIKVYTFNGGIVVDGASGEQVWVFDIMGRQLYNALIRDSRFEIQSSKFPSGVYLVKVGNRKAQKVVLL